MRKQKIRSNSLDAENRLSRPDNNKQTEKIMTANMEKPVHGNECNARTLQQPIKRDKTEFIIYRNK